MIGKPLAGKVALITGSSRGIGRAIALRMAELGADVAVNFLRQRQKAEEVAEEIQSLGQRAVVIKANIADEESLRRLFRETVEGLGRLDIFVANAAIAPFARTIDYKPKHFEFAMRANPLSFLIGAQESFRIFVEQSGLTLEELDRMVEAGEKPPRIGGRIIAISSTGPWHYIPGYVGVATAKAAIITLARYLAYELGRFGTTVNVVSGGPIETENMKFFPEEIRNQWIKNTPLGRLGQPTDLAGVVAFLATPDADWINGENIIVDGGLGLI